MRFGRRSLQHHHKLPPDGMLPSRSGFTKLARKRQPLGQCEGETVVSARVGLPMIEHCGNVSLRSHFALDDHSVIALRTLTEVQIADTASSRLYALQVRASARSILSREAFELASERSGRRMLVPKCSESMYADEEMCAGRHCRRLWAIAADTVALFTAS